MKCHVTLVHGTFSPNAAWTFEGSKLMSALQALSPSDVVIHRHPWSAKNTHTARFKAADALAKHVNDIAKDGPDSRQIIISHSHGGNIALYALKDPAAFEAVDLVVCMSTPFIQVQPRPVALWKLGNLEVAIRLGAFLLAAFYAIRYRSFLGIFIYFLLTILWPFVERSLGNRLGERALDWFHKLSLSPKPARELLIIRTTGDEASASLGATQFLSWLSAKSLEYLPSHLPRTRLLRPGLLLAAVIGIGAGTYLKVQPSLGWINLLLWIFGTLNAVLLILLILGPLLSVVFYCIVSLAYGPELLLSGALLEITAEATPNGSWTVHCFAPELPKEGDVNFYLTSMRHSEHYDDDRVIKMICERVLQVIRESPR